MKSLKVVTIGFFLFFALFLGFQSYATAASISVSAISGPTEEYQTGTATFTVTLSQEPTDTVTINVTCSDPTEGTVDPNSVVFAPGDWSARTLTVTGVDDADQDGDVTYQVILYQAVSNDTAYNNYDPNDVTVTNIDDDTPDIIVSPISGDTTETGNTATFTVKLKSAPSATVTIPVSSNNEDEGTVDPNKVEFTSTDWHTAKTVTVTGQDDQVDDDDVSYKIILGMNSTDSAYGIMDPNDVDVTNIDDDDAGVTVGTISGSTTEDGDTATFTVVLDSKPTNTVTIPVSSDDTTEGTVDPNKVVFTVDNWNTAQTVTVTGQDDTDDDGDKTYTIILAQATSNDAKYAAIDPNDVTVTNTDNEIPGLNISTISGNTSEDGTTAIFTVSLKTAPTDTVTIAVSSDDTTEGTVDPNKVEFTTTNWNQNQIVTVTGQDDNVVDGDVGYHITLGTPVSNDTNYSSLSPVNLDVTNTDNDEIGVTVSGISGHTKEHNAGTATFTVVLKTLPSDTVTIPVSSNDLSEGTVDPNKVIFTTTDWNVAQTVTVTGVDDADQDGSVAYKIILGAAVSTDPNYSGFDPNDIDVINDDDDTPHITVSAISGNTTEAGGTATFTVVLDSEPDATVTIPVTSNDLTEGTVDPNKVVFTTTDWDTPQTVTVTGQDDNVDDGNVAYTIDLGAVVTTGTDYSGMDPNNVAVTNTNDDTAGITVSAISGNTTEAGGTATFTVVLDSEPTAEVTIPVDSSDETEGTVAIENLIFTAANWNTAQTVTVTGVDDTVDDGNVQYQIILTAPTSTDTKYAAIDPNDVTVINEDNDGPTGGAGIIVSQESGLETSETGDEDTFTVKLATEPTAEVTIAVSSSDTGEGTATPASLTFTAANWNTAQTVTVKGVNDKSDDGDITYTINLTASSNDTDYQGKTKSVSVTNTDNDKGDDDGCFINSLMRSFR
ncbi:MAG: hypothetical protein AB1847_07280 [bacterium]